MLKSSRVKIEDKALPRQAVEGDEKSVSRQTGNGAVQDFTQDVVIEKYEGDIDELQESSKHCIHECVRPIGVPRKDTSKDDSSATNPAKKFSYPLDPFQKAAIKCLELGESVLVAAHTSAGKTTVAEYAIAMALRDKARVVYTSPIKALSNQKYRDLAEEFGDVGLMTGDVTLNPNASVIIMTTEILRSILYRGSELVREVQWVIFDEIHYMRDRDRGVVWEESIVLLPDSVRQVFLSATIPNALEFAEWICRVKHQPCHVISTCYRPVPLQHFIFPAGGDGVLLIMDENRKFMEENYRLALNKLKMGDEADPSAQPAWKKRRRDETKENADLPKIIGMCHERSYTPVIVFAFSKMEVEQNALLLDKADLTDEEEKLSIQEIFKNAINTLSEEDRSLPQIESVLPLLIRGIGIHHGGLLPIVKEITELLFQELLIKVLFSTETFSMGINMPAKTVIFTSLYKWDGVARRIISPGEYIQMSGRAGRRGMDKRGLSIVMIQEDIDPDELRKLFAGEPLRLDSQFYLKYNTLLNLLRVEGVDPEYMLRRSFFQFQKEKRAITLEEEKKRRQKQLTEDETIEKMLQEVADDYALLDWREALPVSLRSTSSEELEWAVADFVECVHGLRITMRELSKVTYTEANILRFLQRGRIIHVIDQKTKVDWGYGILLSLTRRRLGPGQPQAVYLDVLLETASPNMSKSSSILDTSPVPQHIEESQLFGTPCDEIGRGGSFEILPVHLDNVAGVTKIIANVNDKMQKSDEFRLSCGMILQAIREKCKGFLDLLDPLDEVKAEPVESIKPLINDREVTLMQLKKSAFYGWKFGKSIFDRYEKKVQVETSIRDIEAQLQIAKHSKSTAELHGMEEVLRRLKYIDENNVVTFKGRISCDISTVDELIIGEILFENIKVSELEIDYLCAMLACLVHGDKPNPTPPEDPKLAELFQQLQEVAKRIAATSVASRLEIDPKAYLAKVDPSLMNATLRWMRKEPFGDILKDTDAYEGSVVRSFRRLEEVLRDLAAACKAMGSGNLEAKFVEALQRLKRGIAFAASLYL